MISSLVRHLSAPMRDWKLRKRLILAFMIIVLLPILALSSFNVVFTRQTMERQVEDSFSDSIYQISERISHQFDNYNAALRFLALNRQLVSIFENTSGTYYQQYSDMTNIYEPMILMITQLSPDFTKVGMYTENHHLAERGQSVIYMEKLTRAPWYAELSHAQPVQWFPQDSTLLGTAWLMKTTRLMPASLVYVTLDCADTFRMYLENIDAYGIRILDGDRVIYADAQGVESLDASTLVDGSQMIDGVRYCAVWQTIEATGWRMCVYCLYEKFAINTGTTLTSLFVLAAACMLLLTMVGTAIAGSISRRVSRLNDSISQVERGQLEVVPESRDKDEIGELTQHFADMVTSLKHYIQINYENKALLREAELKALQAQINPHFLYNSLSLINWKALEINATDIGELVCALSSFYRSVLNKGKSLTTVENELCNIRCYLLIQLAMHDHQFEVHYDIDENMLGYEMLGVILQPIVENAIEHGLDQRRQTEGARLDIHGWLENGDIHFAIEDNGPGLTQAQFDQNISVSSKGYGLKNVQDRIRIAYGEDYGLRLDTAFLHGTRLLVCLPGQRSEKTETNPRNVMLNPDKNQPNIVLNQNQNKEDGT